MKQNSGGTMQTTGSFFAFALFLVAVAQAQQPNASDAVLNRYFELYCNYTGGLGIRHVASHKYDYEFRQRLKGTQDRELKRLFVLEQLYRGVDFDVHHFEQGIIDLGKGLTREMTPDERVSRRKEILQKLDDLSSLDPKDPLGEIASHRHTVTLNGNGKKQ